MQSFIETADSRETSVEIMEAILFVAGGNEAEAARIWQEPSEPELLAIWERVTQNGLIDFDSTEFCWGCEGSQWAKGIEQWPTSRKSEADHAPTLARNLRTESAAAGIK